MCLLPVTRYPLPATCHVYLFLYPLWRAMLSSHSVSLSWADEGILGRCAAPLWSTKPRSSYPSPSHQRVIASAYCPCALCQVSLIPLNFAGTCRHQAIEYNPHRHSRGLVSIRSSSSVHYAYGPVTENETPLLRYSIYFYDRTTYIVITAEPQYETSIRIRKRTSNPA